VETPIGRVTVRIANASGSGIVLLARGRAGLAAHSINHRANIAALVSLGVTDVVATAINAR
jgi:purine nucleoside phosphorylase